MVPQETAGFLGYDNLRPIMNPDGRPWDLTSWSSDSEGQFVFFCDYLQESRLSPSGLTTSRDFDGGIMNAMDASHVEISLAQDTDERTAVANFDACRQASNGTPTPVPDLGDEAFEAVTESTMDGNEHTVFVRVGSRYVVLQAFGEPHEIEMARAAVAALTAAARLS